MKEAYKGSDIVRWLVIVADFIILNFVLFLAINWDKISVPIVFFHASKICYFVANVSLFLGELLFASIIHIRKIRFIQVLGRTFKLIFATILIFNLTMSYLLKGGYDLIKFSIYFAAATYICLILSRYAELNILKYYRSRGRNIKTVLFIGNDPAVIEMYNTLMEDPSAGYRVHGYYANEPIANAPKEFKWLGDMEHLNKVMAESINNTINGIPNNIEEVFCCLSHDFSNEIVRIMQFCDKNVIHFIICHANSENIACTWIHNSILGKVYLPIAVSLWRN